MRMRITGTEAQTGAAVVLLLATTALAQPERVAWLYDERQAIEASVKSGKPLLIDFRAEWCAACKMMDWHTWADPFVQREIAEHFVPLSLDLTAENEANQELARKYDVAGLPTIVVVWCRGFEKACTIPGEGPARLTGYAAAAEMLERLRMLERPTSY